MSDDDDQIAQLEKKVDRMHQALFGTEEDRESGLVQTVRRIEQRFDTRSWMILAGVVLGPVAGVLVTGYVK